VNKARARVTISCYTGLLAKVLPPSARSRAIAVTQMRSLRRGANCEGLPTFVAEGDLILTFAIATLTGFRRLWLGWAATLPVAVTQMGT
jgi:hypothetical protein